MKEYEQKICNIVDNMKAEIRYQCDRIQEQAYKQGYATGYDRENEDGLKDGYERGLNDAWNVAKKVNEIDADVYDKLFPMALTEGFYDSYTAKEVIEKLAEYEEKQKQKQKHDIKVGDEVMTELAEHGVAVRDTYYIGADKEPFTLVWFGTHMSSCPVSELAKTGKHYPQIAEVLTELRGAENDE